MPRTNTLPSYGALVAPAETYLAFWRGMFQASSNATLWWTRKWLDTPKAFLEWSPTRYAALAPAAAAAPKTVAAIIDLAQAAAARAAAELSNRAEQVVEIAETAAEIPVSVAEDAVSVE